MLFADELPHLAQLRDTSRRFVDAEMPRERVRGWDREHRFPPELFQKPAALGVCGLTIDEAHGGQGRDLVAVEIALACQRVMGAYGLSGDYDMERHVRDLLAVPIVGGSSNMQRNNIANRLKLAEE